MYTPAIVGVGTLAVLALAAIVYSYVAAVGRRFSVVLAAAGVAVACLNGMLILWAYAQWTAALVTAEPGQVAYQWAMLIPDSFHYLATALSIALVVVGRLWGWRKETKSSSS